MQILLALIIALQLQGGVSNRYGRVGIRINTNHQINHVYRHSPANRCGLHVGDVVLQCDGKKGHALVDGMTGTSASVTIKRGEQILQFSIPRVAVDEIWDNGNDITDTELA